MTEWVARRPWLVFVLPFAVYMVVGALEPKPPKEGEPAPMIEYRYYPIIYTARLVLTVAAIALVLPGYRKFPPRVTLLGILVGVVGIFIWVGLWKLHLEERLLGPLGLGRFIDLGARSAFDPLQELEGGWAWAFLAVRFFGLVAVVPVIEEFFLRGFLMPLCVRPDWENVPFGEVNRTAVLVGIAYAVISHPAELLAAAAWFSLVTWLMVRTKNIWDCVAAHAVTNLLLGAYVLYSGHWELM